ncbi:hypothetical protein EYF80_018513 [Liparis tanakae]|uniref:Uncharacterized protein n=1 Tax=Liparis tanakae TaxID=230148 RepID=A0A4Z2I0Q3_9TELE|nr:hypothetical protein EYF80_018513 [Liparis tanakae]
METGQGELGVKYFLPEAALTTPCHTWRRCRLAPGRVSPPRPDQTLRKRKRKRKSCRRRGSSHDLQTPRVTRGTKELRRNKTHDLQRRRRNASLHASPVETHLNAQSPDDSPSPRLKTPEDARAQSRRQRISRSIFYLSSSRRPDPRSEPELWSASGHRVRQPRT